MLNSILLSISSVRNRFLFCKKLVADEIDFVLDTVKLEFIVPYVNLEYEMAFVLEIVQCKGQPYGDI